MSPQMKPDYIATWEAPGLLTLWGICTMHFLIQGVEGKTLDLET